MIDKWRARFVLTYGHYKTTCKLTFLTVLPKCLYFTDRIQFGPGNQISNSELNGLLETVFKFLLQILITLCLVNKDVSMHETLL